MLHLLKGETVQGVRLSMTGRAVFGYVKNIDRL